MEIIPDVEDYSSPTEIVIPEAISISGNLEKSVGDFS
jgi:hypothetical protein